MSDDNPKPIRLSRHAQEQCAARGASFAEIETAVRRGEREEAKRGRWLCRYNVAFDQEWQGRRYAIKQVVPVIAEEPNELVVVTVYTFYF